MSYEWEYQGMHCTGAWSVWECGKCGAGKRHVYNREAVYA